MIVTSTHGGIGVQDGLRLMKSADRRRVSVVGMDQWSVMADVMHLVVEYGHRSVLYFAGPKEWRDAATRLLAWNKLCAANAVNSVTVQCETWESSEAYGKMNHILDNIGRTGGNLPTCMVCANDSQAVGVARALHEHGVRIPQDVSLVGFDDMPAMDNMFPPLTTVRPGFEQLGVAAMRETLYLLGGGGELLRIIAAWRRTGVGEDDQPQLPGSCPPSLRRCFFSICLYIHCSDDTSDLVRHGFVPRIVSVNSER